MARSVHSTATLRSFGGWTVFGLAIFLPAFLIFLVQPMVGKRVLPWFGGTPAVWVLCLSFYQTTLFAGYAYAHLLIRFVPPTLQLFVHASFVAVAILARPILPDSSWAVGDHASPIREILAILSIHVALPFIVLASTGPLVQSWFATRYPDRSPYPLYAVSNFGSLLALAAFPFWIEPRFGLEQTGIFWSWTFSGAMILVLGTAALAWRAASPSESDSERIPAAASPQGVEPSRVVLWLILPAAAVLMLNGLTNRLCLDVASVPFLWILPLGTYLVTFIISFSSESLYRRRPYFALAFVLLVISTTRSATFALEGRSSSGDLSLAFGSIQVGIAYFCLLLYTLCSILHGELYRLRPAPERLTAFYLCVSGGGAIGGLFVGIAAPSLFDGYFEFMIGLCLCLALGVYCAARDSGGLRSAWQTSSPLLRTTVCVGILLVAFESFQTTRPMLGQVHQERSFFGVLRVLESQNGSIRYRDLMHGTTRHGAQAITSPESEHAPTTYYGNASVLAALMATRSPGRPARIGIVGLGIGTIASYGRDGDFIRFYEIDPAVIRIASDESRFTFLSNSAADVEVRQGDGRLLLQQEQRAGDRQDFDILVIDAFSSDSIPVHLLTREAFEVYAAALSENGVVATHVTNRHFDLTKVAARIGHEAGLTHLISKNNMSQKYLTIPSKWVFLAKSRTRLARIPRASKALLNRLGLARDTQSFQITPRDRVVKVPLWTDDYTDLFGVLMPLEFRL